MVNGGRGRCSFRLLSFSDAVQFLQEVMGAVLVQVSLHAKAEESEGRELAVAPCVGINNVVFQYPSGALPCCTVCPTKEWAKAAKWCRFAKAQTDAGQVHGVLIVNSIEEHVATPILVALKGNQEECPLRQKWVMIRSASFRSGREKPHAVY